MHADFCDMHIPYSMMSQHARCTCTSVMASIQGYSLPACLLAMQEHKGNGDSPGPLLSTQEDNSKCCEPQCCCLMKDVVLVLRLLLLHHKQLQTAHCKCLQLQLIAHQQCYAACHPSTRPQLLRRIGVNQCVCRIIAIAYVAHQHCTRCLL